VGQFGVGGEGLDEVLLVHLTLPFLDLNTVDVGSVPGDPLAVNIVNRSRANGGLALRLQTGYARSLSE